MSTRTLHDLHGTIRVHPGPGLLAGLDDGPSLAAHQGRYGALPEMRLQDLVALTSAVSVHGRGGAGFPFARKLQTAGARRGRKVVVVNVSEGEPASLKDGVLAQVAPHLVLDGASVTAAALGADEIHLVLPGERPEVGLALRKALMERREARSSGLRRTSGRDGRIRWSLHDAANAFVAGQSAAVLELLAGRPNLPVTTWVPSAHTGHRGRATVLSNAETYAHVARLALLGLGAARSHGSVTEPGTTLLTLDGDTVSGRTPSVVEVAFGTPWRDVLPEDRLGLPVLVGGYHGTWAGPGALTGLAVSPTVMAEHGIPLGAGIVLPLDDGCPVAHTSRITAYLAAQSARRCGPCLNGLPALAGAVESVSRGTGGVSEVERLSQLVDRRGACAHPDGTVRLVRSMLDAYPDEVRRHAQGRCAFARTAPALIEVSA